MIGALLTAVAPLALAAGVAGLPAPAPAGGAEAAGVRAAAVDSCVSCTSVSARRDGTSSRATAVRLFGRDLQGGSSRDGGSAHGALLALPSNPVFDLALASWMTGTETGGPPAAQSRTALIDLGVLPSGEDSTTGGLVTVAVLESFSDATWSGPASHGYGAANGADIGLANGAVVVILLHSEATGDQHGDAYMASVAGAPLLAAGGDNPGTPVPVPGALGLTLLRSSATGGNATPARS